MLSPLSFDDMAVEVLAKLDLVMTGDFVVILLCPDSHV